MNIKEYEDMVENELRTITESIIDQNPTLSISAKSRAGAEISDWLEEEFVSATKSNHYINDAEAAPKGKTKNPWDAKCLFTIRGHTEEIWIDFKAFKISSKDSNPDIGTPSKVIKFIQEGGFYLLYIHVFYRELGDGLEFVSQDGVKAKSYFLKNISHTFRRTPTNQLQVNIAAVSQYRTREEFVRLLMVKLKEGLERQLISAQRKIEEVDNVTERLLAVNVETEKKLVSKIQ